MAAAVNAQSSRGASGHSRRTTADISCSAETLTLLPGSGCRRFTALGKIFAWPRLIEFRAALVSEDAAQRDHQSDNGDHTMAAGEILPDRY
jgi:hypothetical protein